MMRRIWGALLFLIMTLPMSECTFVSSRRIRLQFKAPYASPRYFSQSKFGNSLMKIAWGKMRSIRSGLGVKLQSMRVGNSTQRKDGPRSLMEATSFKVRSFGWRWVMVSGAVLASGVLTSAIMQAARRRLEALSESNDSSSDLWPMNYFDRLDILLHNTSMALHDVDNSTSVLLVFDCNGSPTSEEYQALRMDRFNLIANEVAQARTMGEKACRCHVYLSNASC